MAGRRESARRRSPNERTASVVMETEPGTIQNALFSSWCLRWISSRTRRTPQTSPGGRCGSGTAQCPRPRSAGSPRCDRRASTDVPRSTGRRDRARFPGPAASGGQQHAGVLDPAGGQDDDTGAHDEAGTVGTSYQDFVHAPARRPDDEVDDPTAREQLDVPDRRSPLHAWWNVAGTNRKSPVSTSVSSSGRRGPSSSATPRGLCRPPRNHTPDGRAGNRCPVAHGRKANRVDRDGARSRSDRVDGRPSSRRRRPDDAGCLRPRGRATGGEGGADTPRCGRDSDAGRGDRALRPRSRAGRSSCRIHRARGRW